MIDNQFTSTEKWRQLGDSALITNYIRNFGENVYTNQYLPGRIKYGHDLMGDPLKNLAEEIGDSISYLAMAHAQRKELMEQCMDSRAIIIKIHMYLTNTDPDRISPSKSQILDNINDYFARHIDVRLTYNDYYPLPEVPAAYDPN